MHAMARSPRLDRLIFNIGAMSVQRLLRRLATGLLLLCACVAGSLAAGAGSGAKARCELVSVRAATDSWKMIFRASDGTYAAVGPEGAVSVDGVDGPEVLQAFEPNTAAILLVSPAAIVNHRRADINRNFLTDIVMARCAERLRVAKENLEYRMEFRTAWSRQLGKLDRPRRGVDNDVYLLSEITSLEALRRAAQEGTVEERLIAFGALQLIPGTEGVRLLAEALDDPDPTIARAAREAVLVSDALLSDKRLALASVKKTARPQSASLKSVAAELDYSKLTDDVADLAHFIRAHPDSEYTDEVRYRHNDARRDTAAQNKLVASFPNGGRPIAITTAAANGQVVLKSWSQNVQADRGVKLFTRLVVTLERKGTQPIWVRVPVATLFDRGDGELERLLTLKEVVVPLVRREGVVSLEASSLFAWDAPISRKTTGLQVHETPLDPTAMRALQVLLDADARYPLIQAGLRMVAFNSRLDGVMARLNMSEQHVVLALRILTQGGIDTTKLAIWADALRLQRGTKEPALAAWLAAQPQALPASASAPAR